MSDGTVNVCMLSDNSNIRCYQKDGTVNVCMLSDVKRDVRAKSFVCQVKSFVCQVTRDVSEQVVCDTYVCMLSDVKRVKLVCAYLYSATPM